MNTNHILLQAGNSGNQNYLLYFFGAILFLIITAFLRTIYISRKQPGVISLVVGIPLLVFGIATAIISQTMEFNTYEKRRTGVDWMPEIEVPVENEPLKNGLLVGGIASVVAGGLLLALGWYSVRDQKKDASNTTNAI